MTKNTQPEYLSQAAEGSTLSASKQRKRATILPARQKQWAGAIMGGALLCGLLAFPLFSHTQASTAPATASSSYSTVSMDSYISTTGLSVDLTSFSTSDTSQLELATVAASRVDYVKIARDAARKAGIDPELFVRQIRQESGFNPNARSWAGAIGIAQFMPATAASLGIDPHDPIASLHGAARLMKQLSRQFGGDYAKALAAYNAGPGTVQSAVRLGGKNWKAYLPAETKHYIAVIMG